MKIGILTFHNNENRGSILQAYCLKESLEDLIEGADAEVIDYRTISHEILRIASKNPIEVIKNIKSRSRTEKEFSKLWQRFYKVDNARTRKNNGSGLGLAIVKNIIKKHEGYIDVKSKPQQGTTFSFIL